MHAWNSINCSFSSKKKKDFERKQKQALRKINTEGFLPCDLLKGWNRKQTKKTRVYCFKNTPSAHQICDLLLETLVVTAVTEASEMVSGSSPPPRRMVFLSRSSASKIAASSANKSTVDTALEFYNSLVFPIDVQCKISWSKTSRELGI